MIKFQVINGNTEFGTFGIAEFLLWRPCELNFNEFLI